MHGIRLHSRNVTLIWELSLMVLTAFGDQSLQEDLYLRTLTTYLQVLEVFAMREHGIMQIAISVMLLSELLRLNGLAAGIIHLSEHAMMDFLMVQIVSTWNHHLGLQPSFGKVRLTMAGCEFTKKQLQRKFLALEFNFTSVIF